MKKLLLTIALTLMGSGALISSAQAHPGENHGGRFHCGENYCGEHYCGDYYGYCGDYDDYYDGCSWHYCRRDHRGHR